MSVTLYMNIMKALCWCFGLLIYICTVKVHA